MASKKTVVSVAIGSAFVAGMAAVPMAQAESNPFALQSLDRGYMVADAGMQAKCGAGKCGGAKAAEAKCGEGKCGPAMMDANKDGKVSKDEFMKGHEAMFAKKDTNKDGVLSGDEMKPGMAGKCGAGKCGAGKCGGAKPAAPAKPMDGKCGQGKCGGMK
jgi:uncharacterized low-complexity protein